MTRRRVVVTGLGCVSPVGNTVQESWSNLLSGRSGVDFIKKFDATSFACQFAGEVKGLDLDAYISPKDARGMDAFIHFGIVASIQAVLDAGLPTGADLDDVFLDIATAFSVTGGSASLTSVQFLVSNNYTAAAGTAAYFTTGVLTSNAVGRQTLSTFTGTQINNQSATSTDILHTGGQPILSQVVVTIAMVGTALDTRTSMAGKLNVTLRYTQPDNNIGNTTTYPYGNFD